MWYVYNTYEAAKAAADTVNANYIEPAPIERGGERHGQHPTEVNYCLPVECVEGWAVIADEVTSKYIQGVPQEITFNTPEI
jgi:hypothetical protein